jgi:hypothetical protein
MALNKLARTSFGIELPNAYWRIENVSVTKTEMTFKMRVYNTPDLPAFGEEDHTAPYDIEGENPIKQAYLYLKSLPNFEQAKDC